MIIWIHKRVSKLAGTDDPSDLGYLFTGYLWTILVVCMIALIIRFLVYVDKVVRLTV